MHDPADLFASTDVDALRDGDEMTALRWYSTPALHEAPAAADALLASV